MGRREMKGNRNMEKSKNKLDDYVLFKCKLEWADEDDEIAQLLDEALGKDESEKPEFEVEVWRIQHGVWDKEGWHEEYVTAASSYGDSLVKGSFGSLEEAKLKLMVEGWELMDASEEFRKPGGNEFMGRSVIKAFRLKR